MYTTCEELLNAPITAHYSTDELGEEIVAVECAGVEYIDSEFEDLESALENVAKETTDEDKEVSLIGVLDFIARCLHYRQQGGGDLIYKEKLIEALDIDQTGGSPGSIGFDTILFYDGHPMTVSKIFDLAL